MREFRLLKNDEIECRVQSQTDKGVILLLYKTARTDSKLLDEKFGLLGWQNKYEVINDNLYCSIGIQNPETKEWVWKSNCGTESNTEKEKGEASDALKRAGFTWGIGTELYSSPFIWVKAGDYEVDSKGKCRSKFVVTEIGYDDNEKINLLVISVKDKVVYTYGKKAPRTANKAEKTPICAECNAPITDYKSPSGKVTPKETLIKKSMEQFETQLCGKCLLARMNHENQ